MLLKHSTVLSAGLNFTPDMIKRALAQENVSGAG